MCALCGFKQTGNNCFIIYSSHCLLKTKTLISHGPLLFEVSSNNSVRQREDPARCTGGSALLAFKLISPHCHPQPPSCLLNKQRQKMKAEAQFVSCKIVPYCTSLFCTHLDVGPSVDSWTDFWCTILFFMYSKMWTF